MSQKTLGYEDFESYTPQQITDWRDTLLEKVYEESITETQQRTLDALNAYIEETGAALRIRLVNSECEP